MCRVSPIKTFPRVEVNNSVELTGLLWAEQEEGGAGRCVGDQVGQAAWGGDAAH